MSNLFNNKKILITGASNGLGREAAKAFEKQGAKLILVARSKNKLVNLIQSFRYPKRHIFFDLDLLNFINIVKIKKEITKKKINLDVILHCVGGSLGVNETLFDWDNFQKSLKGNLGVASEINKHFIPIMKKRKSGNIIHVGSLSSYENVASVPYNSAKASITGYVKSIGKEMIKHNVIISGIFPGSFYGSNNSMFRFKFYKPKEFKKFVSSLPQKKLPNAKDYIQTIFLLANPKSHVLAGSLISMDAGQSKAFNIYG